MTTMTIPWLSGRTEAPKGGEVAVMASRFELTTRRAVPSFLYGSIRAWRQALRAEGCIGVSLKAAPIAGEFWTLSAWTSKEHIYDYARTEPHKSISQGQRAAMRTSTFVFWHAPSAEMPTWVEGEARIREQIARRGAGQ